MIGVYSLICAGADSIRKTWIGSVSSWAIFTPQTASLVAGSAAGQRNGLGTTSCWRRQTESCPSNFSAVLLAGRSEACRWHVGRAMIVSLSSQPKGDIPRCCLWWIGKLTSSANAPRWSMLSEEREKRGKGRESRSPARLRESCILPWSEMNACDRADGWLV